MVGQEGQWQEWLGRRLMAGSQIGKGQCSDEGQMAGNKGVAGCLRARWQLLGVVEVAWSRSSRWWTGKGQIRGKGQLEAR